MIDFPATLAAIFADYPLPHWGLHGLSHWARVWENGLALAEQSGADPQVVQLFALFHDSRRVDDGWDLDHGRRGAELAVELRGKTFELDDARFRLLFEACEWHTKGQHHPDPTIHTCWDSDRLDLGRVGILPSPKYLNTARAKEPAMIEWANERALRDHVPALIAELWKQPLRFD